MNAKWMAVVLFGAALAVVSRAMKVSQERALP